MNNQLKAVLATLAAASLSLSAQADTIALWSFETNTPADLSNSTASPAFVADVGTGSASGAHASAATDWTTPAGNGSANSFSVNTWAIGDYYQFSVSTAGYTGISLSWDQTSSGTGPRDFSLSYSTNGVSFTNVLNYSVLTNGTPYPAWNATTSSSLYSLTNDLSAVTALNNQTQVFFRLTDSSTASASGSTVAAGGTDRVDNFSVNGVAAVPVPAAAWLLGSGLLGLAGVARKRRTA